MPAAIDPAALAGWDRGAMPARFGGATMGTMWTVACALPRVADAGALHQLCQAALDRLVAEMSHWERDSTLGRFNRAPAGSWTSLPPAFATVMAAAIDVAERSGGAFDPAIGAVVDLWGFGPVAVEAPPAPQALADAMGVSGWRRLRFDAASRRLLQPGGLRLDLSGIAKGFAADHLAELLAREGVRHALVEVGGELAGRGLKLDGDPWWVELEVPGVDVAPLRVALHQLGVATSGDYVRGRHTIDPRTGHPVAHSLSVSVIHRSAMLADAWATALGVLEGEALADLAIREGLAVRALVRGAGGVIEWISPALAAMIAD